VNLVGHGFPDGRPFGTRRGQNVFDTELSECFDQGFAAIELIFHVCSPELFFLLVCIISRLNAQDPARC
jgi:hypothetical protein